jgi:anaerobic ribonucleoside-triphosphate reductase activating protein
VDLLKFDYIKTGPYIAHLGPLNKPTTNQRLYKQLPDGTFDDITARFWKK